MIRVHLFISGRVQMVLFRATMQQKARKLRLKGFVKNLRDRRVEAIIEGDGGSVKSLIEWSKKGPFFARVRDVEIIEENYKKEFDKFEIRY